MNFFGKLFLGTVVSIMGYFIVCPYLEPHIEALQDKLEDWREAREEAEIRKLDRELERLEEQEPLIDARLANQDLQDRVDEKKRRLESGSSSFWSKLWKEWNKE